MSDKQDYNPNAAWIVDGKHYMSKMEATLASVANNNSEISFYYYNKEFGAFDWTVEPSESWEELCKQRAQQLRDENQYLRLWYSGGADSHTMLRAFIDNKIHLDEIVMMRASPIDNFESVTNRETFHRSMPYVNSIRHEIPNTKLSTPTVGSKVYEDYYKTDDWFMHTMGVYHFCDDPGVLLDSRTNLEKYSDLTVPLGCVEITGNCKAKVIRHEGKYYFGIVDSGFWFLHWSNNKEFYTTPEFPQIHSKQCHELKHIVERWYPKGNAHADIYTPETIDPLFEIEWYNCSRSPLADRTLDYGKTSLLFHPKTVLRMNDARRHNPKLIKLFMSKLTELQKEVSYHWPDINSPMQNVRSNWYCLGPYPK